MVQLLPDESGDPSVFGQPLTHARAAYTSGRSLAWKMLQSDVTPVEPERFHEMLDVYSDDDTVFVHAGLSDVGAAFKTNPYEFLYKTLSSRFESVLAPGFTPTFKQSGIFHRQYSQPEYGTFYRLLLDDCDFRTDDPLHSILVWGPYRFESCDTRDTFCKKGCYAQLDKDDVLYLNVGTPYLRCTQIHYLEALYDVPYVERPEYEGVVYYDESNHERVTQRNYNSKNTRLYAHNMMKLEQYLIERGVMEKYNLGGLQVSLTHARRLRQALGPKIEEDPYYMVS